MNRKKIIGASVIALCVIGLAAGAAHEVKKRVAAATPKELAMHMGPVPFAVATLTSQSETQPDWRGCIVVPVHQWPDETSESINARPVGVSSGYIVMSSESGPTYFVEGRNQFPSDRMTLMQATRVFRVPEGLLLVTLEGFSLSAPKTTLLKGAVTETPHPL